MKPLEVVVSVTAQSQIADQVRYIARDSVDNALAWEQRLADTVANLGLLHGSHAIDEQASERIGKTIHKVVFEQTYLIHYRTNALAGIVEVLNFRHGMRLPRSGEP